MIALIVDDCTGQAANEAADNGPTVGSTLLTSRDMHRPHDASLYPSIGAVLVFGPQSGELSR